jgi:hypothetical protein
MIKKEHLINIIELYRKFDKKTDDFNEKLENLLNSDFETDEPVFDGSCWLYWPIEGVRQIIKQILMDCGESEEGASWWLYENDFSFPTEIGLNGKDYEIKDYDSFYEYLKTLNEVENAKLGEK